MAELGPDDFYTLNISLLLSSKGTEKTQPKFWIKCHLVAKWYTEGCIYSLHWQKLYHLEVNVLCSTLACFLVILIWLVVTIYTAGVLEKLTTTVLFSCAHAEESFQIINQRDKTVTGWMISKLPYALNRESMSLPPYSGNLTQQPSRVKPAVATALLLCLKLMFTNWVVTDQ